MSTLSGLRRRFFKMKKQPKLNPNAPRHLWLRCRVNEWEKMLVESDLAAIDAENVGKFAQRVADRITARFERAGQDEQEPFPNVASFLRCVLGLPPISAGAPVGNQNRRKKQ